MQNARITDELPTEITQGATRRGNEYGWNISLFPQALANAEKMGYACLGGQFQFRLDDGSTCEMYWLNADSTDRRNGETWSEYVRRSCFEVLKNFQRVISEADLFKEAQSWGINIDPTKYLVFVGYFVKENDLADLVALRNSRP